MICQQARENFIPYLYQELDRKTDQSLLEHLEKCPDCKKQIADMTRVGTIVSLSNPDRWRKKREKNIFWGKSLAWAAAFLISFASGWIYLYFFHGNSHKEKILQLLVQNQKYRASLTEEQGIIVRAMEKEIAFFAGISSPIEYVHKIENAIGNKKWKEAFKQKQEFFLQYPGSPLHLCLEYNLATSLFKAGEYDKAKNIYRNLLEQVFATPEERGKTLWNMAICLEKTGEKAQYHALLEKLEANPIYESYAQKAILALADEDFGECRFLSARMRYQKYLERNGEKNREVERCLEWINYHEKDAFYPLTLFVQARKKGMDYYYGLKIILEDYPESPLAFAACEMYLQSQPLQIEGKPVFFPETQSMDTLISYLGMASESPELQEIAIFVSYWKACLLEEKGMPNLAMKLYQKIQEQTSYTRISDLAREAIYRINPKKQRRDL